MRLPAPGWRAFLLRYASSGPLVALLAGPPASPPASEPLVLVRTTCSFQLVTCLRATCLLRRREPLLRIGIATVVHHSSPAHGPASACTLRRLGDAVHLPKQSQWKRARDGVSKLGRETTRQALEKPGAAGSRRKPEQRRNAGTKTGFQKEKAEAGAGAGAPSLNYSRRRTASARATRRGASHCAAPGKPSIARRRACSLPFRRHNRSAPSPHHTGPHWRRGAAPCR